MSHTHLKIFFENEIRLLGITPPYPDWPSFIAQISSLFSHQITDVRIYYNDDENDRVLIDSSDEWHIALSILIKQKIGKLYIENRNPTNKNKDDNTPSFNDTEMKDDGQLPFSRSGIPFRFGRHPVGRGFCRPPFHPHDRLHGWHHMRPTRGHCRNPDNGHPENIDVNNNNNINFRKELNEESRGPRGCPWRGSRGFEGFNNLQGHKKDFHAISKFHRSLRMAKKSKKLERKMHKRAYQELEEKNFSVASKLYEALISLCPRDPIAFYNMACCDALSGATDSALTNLALAVENGYSDSQHVLNDQDFESIRDHPQFHFIVDGMTSRE
eukprot:TRINITY_DN10801_c0_g1_i1.p1 TRINITY_DN10801_c0_g1~~TRINITY_DN10801_c0_g1_i1.p1  ORF type:complete len:352 (+),score=67.47 TRINITY_DN10801_c0_g1_i1:76-1056(+)